MTRMTGQGRIARSFVQFNKYTHTTHIIMEGYRTLTCTIFKKNLNASTFRGKNV